MATETILELYKQQQNLNEKHTYFLLAAAGAAIGFAVQKTEGLLLSWWLAPVGLAILCWGASFFYGCKHIGACQAVISLNSDLLEVSRGTHHRQPPPQITQAILQDTKTELDKNVRRSTVAKRAQFRLLIEGAVLFVLWRVLEMVRATYFG